MYVVGAICARGGSKGVPRKNLREIGGRSLLGHAVACAQEARTLHRIVVSTDDAEMAAAARRYGAEVPFMRPAELAQDQTSKWDVFRHLVSTLEGQDGRRVDVLVDLDTGVPLRRPEDVDGCVNQLLAGSAEVVVTAYEPERNPYFNMVEPGPDGFCRIVKQPPEPIVARQAAPQVYALSPAVYAITRDALWRVEHWSQARLQVYPIPRLRAIDIDTEADLRLVECILASAPA